MAPGLLARAVTSAAGPIASRRPQLLSKGDYLKNNAVLQARSEYVDFDEPEHKRHLVRLWLTAHGEWADGDAFVQQGIPQKEGVVSDADDVSRVSAKSAG